MTEDTLLHYGVKRRSGRYPWGSGEDPYQSVDWLSNIQKLRTQGMSEKQIAEELGMNTTALRTNIAWANQIRKENIMRSVTSMREQGMTNTAIAKELGMSESSVRNYVSNKEKNTINQLDNIAEVLRESAEEHTYLDIGVGVERQMGISRTKLRTAVAKLKEEGYVEHEIYVKRLNDPTKYTTIMVLTKETDLEIVKQNSDQIRPIESWTDDGGTTFGTLGPIEMVSWNRLGIVYAEDGGSDRDGLIELRRGVKDLDLGDSSYAQVRIGVGPEKDGSFLKGMAVYSDNLPDGVDIQFHTNKPLGTPKESVLKPMKDSTLNPFGATIRRQNGALNIVNEEGHWNEWQKLLSAQFLSKQPTALVKERLDATFEKLQAEHKELTSLTNPLVKKHLLESYYEGLDSKVQHLKVQGLPRTKGHVLLPFPDMNPNEVYAPNYKNGERVVLIRYPHGGIFEIPELTVNNKGPAKSIMGNALDAIGIHPAVAHKLSGADFDGDTVWVIPNNDKKIKVSRSLKELRNFDPIALYQVPHTTITKRYQQTQMGIVSNLITDMTIKKATQAEIARAVRHSMVVIDAEKHKLNWKKSAEENGISALQKRYQTHINPITGKQSVSASTLISKSKKKIDTVDEKGRTVKTSILDMVDDVRKLSSGTAVENLYADYANKVKALSNSTKKLAQSISPIKYDRVAAKTYAPEVKSLDKKLNTALLNAPRERQAQLLASNTYYKNLDYEMTTDQKKRLKNQALADARVKTNAGRKLIEVTPKEWTAIQAGAISNNKLSKILNNTDMDKIKQLATPRPASAMTSARIARAKTLLDRGYTYAEVAEAIGVSATTIRNEIVT